MTNQSISTNPADQESRAGQHVALADSSVPYGWVIDEDHITDDEDHRRYTESDGKDGLPSRVGRMGPHDIPAHLVARLKVGEGIPFRLLGDVAGDGDHIDYVGRLVTDDTTFDDMLANGDALIAPLTDFGPDAGSTAIMHRVNHAWVQLVS